MWGIIDNHLHGYAHLPWEHYLIPSHIWKQLERDEHGCWLWRGRKDVDVRMALFTRLTGKARSEVIAVVPTCGVIECANPAHTCLTLKQER
jgi:hypothetical protein